MKATKEATKKAADYKKSEQKAAAEAMLEVRSTPADDRITRAYRIKFTSPIIMNKFDQKSVEEILHRQMGHPVEQMPKKPRECIERATTRNSLGQVCLLPAAFKKSILTGSSGLTTVKGLQLRTKLFVVGHSIPIEYSSQINRMDMVKVGPWNNRVADVRFRPQFNDVRCIIAVRAPAKVDESLIVELINRGGEVGIGEWRPEKLGEFGTYEVESVVLGVDELQAVITACEPLIPPLVIPDWALDAEISPELLKRIASGDLDADETKSPEDRPMTDEERAEYNEEEVA